MISEVSYISSSCADCIGGLVCRWVGETVS